MTDSAIVDGCRDLNSGALIEVALLYKMTTQDLVEEHERHSKFTTIRKSLLGLSLANPTLRRLLHSLQSLGSLAQLIDEPDSRGRSALAWAVEYSMADEVRTLLSFGANACQYRRSLKSQFPLLHLVIAGPSPPPKSASLEVVKILLAISVDINARDDEGWSAWHVAASWRSYDILREIMRTHGTCVELDARTNEGESAHELSQDEDFYRRLLPNWKEAHGFPAKEPESWKRIAEGKKYQIQVQSEQKS